MKPPYSTSKAGNISFKMISISGSQPECSTFEARKQGGNIHEIIENDLELGRNYQFRKEYNLW